MSLIVVVSVLLVLVILAQNSKGGGLSSQFGGSGASNMIGVKKTTDLLEKITWGLAITLCVLAISSKFVGSNNTNNNSLITPSIERAQEQQAIPSLDLGNSEGIDVSGLENDLTTQENPDSL
ncbi:MAG: preprotein translocase subunit SecG [Cyclobacteriaceae bacterium]|nr:preprotein translocase subunit SecG [Cyclobacteriaceae bacterium]